MNDLDPSTIESMDCSDQNTESTILGALINLTETSAACVPGCSNRRGNDNINGRKQSYYRFPKDSKQLEHVDENDRIWSDHFERGISIFELLTPMNI